MNCGSQLDCYSEEFASSGFMTGSSADQRAYRSRLAAEEKAFTNRTTVHSLPPIFDYWSDKYVRPKLRAVGFAGSVEVFTDSMKQQCERLKGHSARFLSIGSGNCDKEIEFALSLREAGHSQFIIDCLDLNESMLDRGRSAAAENGLSENMNPVQADLNDWRPLHEYDGVIASHVLHHVVNLEGLFLGIKRSLRLGGCFAIADVVGRNGHMRWPEALPIVQEFWRKLPPSYRYNHQLRRYEEVFEDRDCSAIGFEGIRSQDILPLLTENFYFQRFVAFGNVVFPFIDRSFGPNFDASAKWDREFIDAVHQRDEEDMIQGRIKPTQIFAVVGTTAGELPIFQAPFSPAFCVRRPESVTEELHSSNREILGKASQAHALGQGESTTIRPYEWHTWPHKAEHELEIACERLGEAEMALKKLEGELDQRGQWALQLEESFNERTKWALQLENELDERTTRAQQLRDELQERTTWALQMEKELQDRTAWALQMDKELQAWRSSRQRRSIIGWVLAVLRAFRNGNNPGNLP